MGKSGSDPKSKYEGILKMSAEEMPKELVDLLDKHKVSEAFSGNLKQYLDYREFELEEKFTEVKTEKKQMPRQRQTYTRSRDYTIKTIYKRETNNKLSPSKPPLVKSLSNANFSSNSLTTQKVLKSTKSATKIYFKEEKPNL